ncbi:MAG TPA: hypothetical protein VF752_17760 [Thermoleophilaceae bacterium]
MQALPILWLATPFITGVCIASSHAARRFTGRHYVGCLLAGWAGVTLLLAAAFLLDGPIGTAALIAGGPLAGLSFWLPRRGNDEDGGDEPADEPSPTPPDGDWDRFLSDFWTYVDHRRRPSSPAPRERVSA